MTVVGSETARDAFVSVRDGSRIFYRVEGRGAAVVLSDGIICDGFVWKYLRPALARTYRVLHWNYRGHGRSGPPRDRERVAVRDHAEDLLRVLDHAAIDRAALLGHSMGTQVCLETCRLAPDRTAALGLLCGSWGRVTRTFHDTDALNQALPALIDFCVAHPTFTRAMFAMAPSRLAVQIARFTREIDPLRVRTEDMLPYFEHVSEMDPEVFLRMLRGAGEHSAEDLLHRIDAPTLVIAGERDSFTPARLARQMADQIPGAEFVLVPEGTHTCPIEQPDLVNTRVEKFLRERVYADVTDSGETAADP